MTASPYASDAKIAEALAVIEAENVGTRKQTILQQIFVACALGGTTPSAPPVPQNLRLAAFQNPETITVEWDSIPSSPDFEVEVYTPDDIWVSLGGTMGGTSREYGVSDGMVFGATYSFRVRSTFDFATFSDWSTPLYGVVAPPPPIPTLYYIDQGSGLWNDSANWFQDSTGTIPHGFIPTGSDNCEINTSNTVDEVPSSGYNSVTNNGTVTANNGTITTNESIVDNNYGAVTNNNGTVNTNNSGGTVTTNNGTVTDNANNGTVTTNQGTVTTNNGTVNTNNSGGAVNNNNGTVTTNASGGEVTTNEGTVTTNSGTVADNASTVTTNASGGVVGINSGTVGFNDFGSTVTTNASGGTVENNYGGTITTNSGTVADNASTVTTNASGGVVGINSGTVGFNDFGGTVTYNFYGTVTYNCGEVSTNAGGFVGPCPA